METVSIDNPLGGIMMLNETLSSLGGLNLLLHARMLASWATPSKQAVMLGIEAKFNILGSQGQH